MTAVLLQTSSPALFGGGNTATPTLNGVTAGSTLIAFVQVAAFNSTAPICSSASYTSAQVGPGGGTGSYRYAQQLYQHAVSSGTHSPAFLSADAADNYGQVILTEWSGLQNAAPDKAIASDGNSNTPATGSTGTLTQANNLILANVCGPTATSPQGFTSPATTGYTSVFLDQGNGSAATSIDSKIVTATTAQTAAWGTIADTDFWGAVITAWKETVAAGAPRQAMNYRRRRAA